MNNYAAETSKETNKAIKKFDDEGGSLQRVASHTADAAQKGINTTKKEGKKDLAKVQDFIEENPVRGAIYALGVGALLSYLLFPRR